MQHYYPLLFYVLLVIIFIRLVKSSFIGRIVNTLITIIFLGIALYIGYIVFIA